ncbi:MAG TPA: response regulator transcription factor [Acidimicrobiales bacterium]|nr:response regulator transcription factor [Acidimicrobiales bacterium]
MSEPIRLLLVDDHEIVRRGLGQLLEASGDLVVVAEAGTLEAALALDVSNVDVAVLDVRLSDGSGVDLCRSLRDTNPDIACLMLTSFADSEALNASVLAGARGYVLKNVRGEDLVESIRRVALGEMLLTPEQIERARERLRRQISEDLRLESLSVQERKILELLSEGLSNREIAEAMFLAEKTVKNYVSNLLAKLGFQRRTEAALFAQRQYERHHPIVDE